MSLDVTQPQRLLRRDRARSGCYPKALFRAAHIHNEKGLLPCYLLLVFLVETCFLDFFSNILVLLTDVMLVVFVSGVVKRRTYDYHVGFGVMPTFRTLRETLRAFPRISL